MKQIRIATRASQLALWQANHVADLIRAAAPKVEVLLVDVTTRGDADQTQPLSQMGGTGVFTREVQRAILENRADIAVHSLKDLPTEILEPDLILAGIPEREVKWDALVLPMSRKGEKVDPADPLAVLPESAKIGTGSLRRQAQLLATRPDLQLAEIRGNLNTRLKKLDDGEYDALILASAGLMRLGWHDRLSCRLQPPVMFPAVGQGALGLECRRDNQPVIDLLKELTEPDVCLATTAERALLAALRAGCHAPVGVDCRLDEDVTELLLTGVVLARDGSVKLEATAGMPVGRDALTHEYFDAACENARNLGAEVARELVEQGAAELIEQRPE